jgi:hypothetical protein
MVLPVVYRPATHANSDDCCIGLPSITGLQLRESQITATPHQSGFTCLGVGRNLAPELDRKFRHAYLSRRCLPSSPGHFVLGGADTKTTGSDAILFNSCGVFLSAL